MTGYIINMYGEISGVKHERIVRCEKCRYSRYNGSGRGYRKQYYFLRRGQTVRIGKDWVATVTVDST